MSILTILKDTPLWVWILFAFLIKRGVNALYDRKMRIERLFFLPILFFIWGGYNVLNETVFTNVALLMFILGILAGGVVGWVLWKNQPRLRKGSYILSILI
ncbi:DUF6622 family protein [Xenorhabdus entomophaga]|uniref:DUF6622 family protein n=1 Tax=Xenorhabdus entomophaga TaxID=3136257 RepID=UPI0030F46253